jgi:hypothetical protein
MENTIQCFIEHKVEIIIATTIATTISIAINFAFNFFIKIKIKDFRFFDFNLHYHSYKDDMPNKIDPNNLDDSSFVKELKIARMQDFLIKHNYFRNILINDEQTAKILADFEDRKGGKYKIIHYLDDFYKRLSIGSELNRWLGLSPKDKEEQFNLVVKQVDDNYGEKYLKKE